MARRERPAGNFASAGLVAAIVRALSSIDPTLLPPDMQVPDPMKTATVDASAKRRLVDHAYARGGAGPLLCVGQYLWSLGPSPVLDVLSRAGEPAVMAGKWMRLERYAHVRNRTQIVVTGGKAMTCRRHAADGAPTAGENALIAGVLLEICRLAGASGLTLDIGGARLNEMTLLSAGPPQGDDLARFTIGWRQWHGGGEQVEESASDRAGPASRRLASLFAGDIARHWHLGSAAAMLAMSRRSLQRELGSEGKSFSGVLRQARVGEAGRLLRDPSLPLADIGYCCGYADQPHFQRDFRRVVNMTPGQYRQLAARPA